MIYALVLFFSPAHAEPFNPMSITPARVVKHLNRPGDAQNFAWQYGQLDLRPIEDGALLAGSSLDIHLSTTRKFARLMHARYGYTLVLASQIDDFITPIFSGFVVDRDGRPIANFKLISRYANHEALLRTMQMAAEKIVRYSADRSSYARLAYKDLLELAGYPREEAVEEVRITSKNGLDRYRKIIRDVTRSITLFDPGRPTWILAELGSILPFNREEARTLSALTVGGTALDRVFVRTSVSLVSSLRGQVDVQARDTCEIDLS